jgi:hypothetical protein
VRFFLLFLGTNKEVGFFLEFICQICAGWAENRSKIVHTNGPKRTNSI